MDGLRAARTCYDHLAGRLGVALTDGWWPRAGCRTATPAWRSGSAARRVRRARDRRGGAPALRRPLTRRCVDWTERRPHLAGALGAAVATRALELGWVARVPADRALTDGGRRARTAAPPGGRPRLSGDVEAGGVGDGAPRRAGRRATRTGRAAGRPPDGVGDVQRLVLAGPAVVHRQHRRLAYSGSSNDPAARHRQPRRPAVAARGSTRRPPSTRVAPVRP